MIIDRNEEANLWRRQLFRNNAQKNLSVTIMSDRLVTKMFKLCVPPLQKRPVLLRWGWVFLERTRNLSGIQFTTHFIDFFLETKRFVGSTVNVILSWQTRGQRSSKAAESKRRALGLLYMGESHLILKSALPVSKPLLVH